MSREKAIQDLVTSTEISEKSAKSHEDAGRLELAAFERMRADGYRTTIEILRRDESQD